MIGLNNTILKNPLGLGNSTGDKTIVVQCPQTEEPLGKVHKDPDSGQHEDLISSKYQLSEMCQVSVTLRFSLIFGEYSKELSALHYGLNLKTSEFPTDSMMLYF